MHPEFDDETVKFLQIWREWNQSLGYRLEWIPKILEHIYGVEKAEKLVKKYLWSQPKKAKEKSLKRFLTSTQFLTNGMMIVSVVLFLSGNYLGEIFYGNKIPLFFNYLMAIFVIVPWMIGGVFIILRKEIPRFGRKSITGWPAVILGAISLLITLIAGIALILELVRVRVQAHQKRKIAKGIFMPEYPWDDDGVKYPDGYLGDCTRSK